MKCLPLYNEAYKELLCSFEKAMVAMNLKSVYKLHTPAVREFLFFLESRKVNKLRNTHTKDIVAFHDYLKRRPNMKGNGTLAGSTRSAMMGYVRDFFAHQLQTGYMEELPCDIPKFIYEPKGKRPALSEEEIKLLYKAAKNRTEIAILACGYGCGLRRREISRLNVADVNFTRRELAVRKTKGNKSRTVPIAEHLIDDLKAYLHEERPKNEVYGIYSESFFLSHFGKPLHPDSFTVRFSNIVKRTGNAALITKKPSIHWLRHSIATHMADHGADPKFIRQFMGHIFLDTTMGVYAKGRKLKVSLHKKPKFKKKKK